MTIERIISEKIGCDQDMIKDDSNFVEDLGADSLNIVELVMGIEEHFDIEIPDEDAETLHTVADLKQYIEDYS
jgi:acyl carrier protein